jgi:4-hydroxy-tetrahydrodipicolinate reductase
MRLGIFGGLGKLGSAIAEAASSHPKISAVVIKDTKDDVSMQNFLKRCDVCIDTSSAHGTQALSHELSLAHLSGDLKPLVVASTGHAVGVEALVSPVSKHIPVMYLPNAALSVWHVLQCATQLAQRLGESWDVHIEDYHHKEKKDAPSGTVVSFVGSLESACPWLKGRISISSIRGGKGMIENAIIFSGDHETIRLSHQALNRSVFAKGLIEAALWISTQPPQYYTIEDYLT